MVKLAGIFLSAIAAIAMVIVSAFDIWPNIKWEFFALFGFVAFIALLYWKWWSTYGKLASHRPVISLGPNQEAHTSIEGNIARIQLNPRFRNTGQRPAYQLRIRYGWAPKNVKTFTAMPDFITPNTIHHLEELGPKLTVTIERKVAEQTKESPANIDTTIFMYCNIRYSNEPTRGKWYEDEWWFVHEIGDFSPASIVQKEALEPLVRAEYSDKSKKEAAPPA